MSVLFAATYPQRARALVLYGVYAKRRDPDDDYPWAPTREERERDADALEGAWGEDFDLSTVAPNADAAMTTLARAARTREPQPGGGTRPHPHELDGRRPRGAPERPVPDARAAPDRRPRRARRGGPLPRRAASPVRASSSCRGTTTCPSSSPTRSSTRSRSSSPASDRRPSSDRVLATILFTDLVGSTERATRARRRGVGGARSPSTTRRCGASSTGMPARRSTRRATGSSRSSTGRRGRSAARSRVREALAALGLDVRAGVAHRRGRAAARREAARHRRPRRGARHGARPGGRRPRQRRRRTTSSPAPASSSRTAASTP